MVHKLPLITSKDVNVSSQMYLTIQDNKNRKLLEDEMLKLSKKANAQTELLSKSDPYLQKLVEMLYVNIKSRFQVFGNSFCYMDFKSRSAVSFSDFKRGLEGFSIKMSSQDAKSVFAYLTGSPDVDNTLMSFK